MRFIFERDWYTWSFGFSVTIGAPSRAFEFAIGAGPFVVGFAVEHVAARKGAW